MELYKNVKVCTKYNKTDFENLGFKYDEESDMFDSNKRTNIKIRYIGYNIPYPIRNYEGTLSADSNLLESLKNFPINISGTLYLPTIFEDLTDLSTEVITEVLDIRTKEDISIFKSLKSNLKKVDRLNLTNIKTLQTLQGLENVEISILNLKSLHNIISLEYCPKIKENLSIINCSIKDLTHLKYAKEIIISNCISLTSLNGLPINTEKIRILNCPNLPIIESDFTTQINAGLSLKISYHLSLLQFIIKANREQEINNVIWPENFKEKMPELIKSMSGITKFNL